MATHRPSKVATKRTWPGTTTPTTPVPQISAVIYKYVLPIAGGLLITVILIFLIVYGYFRIRRRYSERKRDKIHQDAYARFYYGSECNDLATENPAYVLLETTIRPEWQKPQAGTNGEMHVYESICPEPIPATAAIPSPSCAPNATENRMSLLEDVEKRLREPHTDALPL